MLSRCVIWAFCLCIVGCQVGAPPNPNSAKDVGLIAPEILKRNLRWAYEELERRKLHGEIDDKTEKKMLAQYARSLLSDAALERMPPDQAWQYGEVYRTAEQWPQAKRVFELAVQVAKDDNRRVNDNLRLAQVLAKLGDVRGAIQHTRSTFNAVRSGKAPILLATLYEIVPAAEGQGHDVELAQLLEGAIQQHLETIVDPRTIPGRMFLLARRHHIHNAWDKVIDLYRKSGENGLAEEAQQSKDEMLGLSMSRN